MRRCLAKLPGEPQKTATRQSILPSAPALAWASTVTGRSCTGWCTRRQDIFFCSVTRKTPTPENARTMPTVWKGLQAVRGGGALGQTGKGTGGREDVWEMEAFYLAEAVANYVLTYSPQKIVLWGGIMHQSQLFSMVRTKVQELLGGYISNEKILKETYLPRAAGTWRNRELWEQLGAR